MSAIDETIGKAVYRQSDRKGKIDPIVVIGPNYARLSSMMQKQLRGVIRTFYSSKKYLLEGHSPLTSKDIAKMKAFERELLDGIDKMVHPKRTIKHAKRSLKEFGNVDMSSMHMISDALYGMVCLLTRKNDSGAKSTAGR